MKSVPLYPPFIRRDIVVTLVDCGQHIAVTGDLFLAAGLRHSLVADDFLEAIIRRNDALDTVGCRRCKFLLQVLKDAPEELLRGLFLFFGRLQHHR